MKEEILKNHGAVSSECVGAMAEGVRRLTGSDFSVATSGIAGPGGGTPTKPVGTIWIAAACNDKIVTKKLQGDNGREKNTKNSIEKALSLLIEHLK